MPRRKHKRNWERVAVVHWHFHWVVAPKGAVCVFECLSATLALQQFFQAINFHFMQTTKHQHTRNPSFFLLPSWRICRLHYQAPVLHEVFRLLRVSKHLYTRGIPKQLSQRWPGPGPDSSQHLKLGYYALVCFLFCFAFFRLDKCGR